MHKQTRRLLFRSLYVKRGRLIVGCSFATLPIAKSAQMLPWYRPGLTKLWHACPKWHAERFPWHAELTAVPLVFISLVRSGSIYSEEYVYNTHVSDVVGIVYKLMLLPNKSASETFLHKSVAVRSVDWIFITGASAWRCRAEYVALDKMFYNLFKQEVVAVPVTSHIFLSHSSRMLLLEI
jgi:hypothetical protein